MTTERYIEIDEVVSYIHKNLYEPLPLSHLAAYAGYSPYHFTRIFKEKVGLSPLYYASSLRLQKAKDLLLHSNMCVRDIGLEIGQQSLGTFTTRFTERVGVTPSEFRNSAITADHHLQALQRLRHWRKDHPIPSPYGTIQGSIQATVPFEGVVLVGLFAKPIPEGLPLYGTLVPSTGEFCFTNVTPGVYYLMATSVSWEMSAIDFLLPHSTLRTRSKKPIIVRPNAEIPYQHVMLHAARQDDPPILISLPLLMNNFLNRVVK
ncbi:helix-turn-helix transcriptional regulator [Paenibacillus sp. UNC451MF]|uniref:helix-turn-helix transcriptional regulator n=1 Tax=Paenibacillus sp. UNC451MF TaxID=1449063 RepID=UPI00048F06DF|nr:AraC family transcriptional regulator [Paenibacillus sp. UNC451MF]